MKYSEKCNKSHCVFCEKSQCLNTPITEALVAPMILVEDAKLYE